MARPKGALPSIATDVDDDCKLSAAIVGMFQKDRTIRAIRVAGMMSVAQSGLRLIQ